MLTRLKASFPAKADVGDREITAAAANATAHAAVSLMHKGYADDGPPNGSGSVIVLTEMGSDTLEQV